MKKLEEEELRSIKGGGLGVYLLIGGIVIFIIGVVDGYVRPLKCNK